MPNSLTALTLRLALDQSSRDEVTEKRTGRPPKIWIGNRVALQFALFSGVAAEATLIDSFANIEQANLVIRATNATGTVQVNKSILVAAFDTGLTWAEWLADTGQHFTVELEDTDTNQAAGTFYWAVEIITTESGPITVGTGSGVWVQDGIGNAGAATAADFTSYSRTESDARYLRIAQLLQEIEDLGGASQATARVNLGIVAGALVHKVAVPAGFAAAGSPGDFAPDHATASLWIYTGDGATHTWLKLAGVNS